MHLFISALSVAIVFSAYTALGTVGFTLQFATTNILNLAFGDMMALSAYIAMTCHENGLNLWTSAGIGVVAGAGLSVLLSVALLLPAARRGMGLASLILVTLAVSIGIQALIEIIWGGGDKTFGIRPHVVLAGGGFQWSIVDCSVVGAAVIGISAVWLYMYLSRTGKAMRAVASNKPLAMAYGIPADRITVLSWALSGLLCGVAGVALMSESVVFNSATGFAFSVAIIAGAFVGGIGSISGAVLGAVIVGLVTQLGAAYSDPSYVNVFALVVLAIVLVLRPKGIVADPSLQREIAR